MSNSTVVQALHSRSFHSFQNTHSTYVQDIVISIISFVVTIILWKATHVYSNLYLPKFGHFQPDLKNRMAVEVACLPMRAALAILCIHQVYNVFEDSSAWTPADTERSLMAW